MVSSYKIYQKEDSCVDKIKIQKSEQLKLHSDILLQHYSKDNLQHSIADINYMMMAEKCNLIK